MAFVNNLIAFVLITGWLYPPGYFLLRVLTGQRPGPRLLALPFGLLAGLLCNVLAGAGHASFPLFAAFYSIFFVLGLLRLAADRCRRPAAPGKLPAATVAALLIIILVFAYQTRVPHRFLGGADFGSYSSTIYNFYARGGINYHSRLISELHGRVPAKAMTPISYTVVDAERGIISPTFPVGFALMASPIHYLLAGFLGTVNATFILYQYSGLLSLVLLFAIGRQAGGNRAGLLAAALLSFSWLQLWLTRTSWGEVPLQMFFLAVIYALGTARQENRPRLFSAAIALAGAAVMLKLEGFLALPMVWLYLFLSTIPLRQRWLYGAAAAGAALFCFLFYCGLHDAFRLFYLPNILTSITAVADVRDWLELV